MRIPHARRAAATTAATIALAFAAVQPASAQPAARYGGDVYTSVPSLDGPSRLAIDPTRVAPPPGGYPAAYGPDPLGGAGAGLDADEGYGGGYGGLYDEYGQATGRVRPRPTRRSVESVEVEPRVTREEVAYAGPHAAGDIVVDTRSKRLFLVRPGGRAISYGVGVGRPGFGWTGIHAITAKREWPSWTPPGEMLRRRPDLPRHMAGGIENPLGARAMYLGSTLYRIHGSNEPGTIGTAVSSGCIRMTNEDVADLYDRVKVGTRVFVE